MGFVKEQYLEQCKKRYILIDNKYVCSDCIEEEELDIKNYILENAIENYCSYCSKVGENISIPLNFLIEYLLECLLKEYGDPDDEGVGYDSSKGGYQLADIYDTNDLFDLLGVGFPDKNLHNDIIYEALGGKQWCKKDPYGSTIDEELFFDWESFSHQIKYKSRFVFYKIDYYFDREDRINSNPYDVLETLGELINKFSLIKKISSGTKIFRGRPHNKKDKVYNVFTLGPLFKEKSIYSNRMSPAGIVMFYGAFEKDCIIMELEDRNEECLTIGIFKTLKNLQLIDFTNIPKISGLFDKKNHEKRWCLKFLHNLIDDFIKPIKHDGKEHVEYVPTQVVTEYLRYIFKTIDKNSVQGIMYPCSKNKKLRSIVLFIDHRQCLDDLLETGLICDDPVLLLDKTSIETFSNVK